MGKLQEFLMERQEEEVTLEVAVSGFPFPCTVKSISEGENKAIRKSCQRPAFDEKTHQKMMELDQDLYNTKLVAACCVEPNFKDAALQEKKGVLGAEALIDKILTSGQFLNLLLAVQKVNNFDDVNELRDEAKN